MKLRLSYIASACLLLFAAIGLMFGTGGQVTLSSAGPAAAEAGLTTVRLLGSGFPAGNFNPANIQILLTPQLGGSTIIATATQYQAVVGSTKRVAFLVPASISVKSSTVFTAGISDNVDGFSSNNTVDLTIDPAASLALISPKSGTAGQTLTVSVTGSYSNFLNGLTHVSTGVGITVTSVSVASPNGLSAQLAISSTAQPGVRTITVTTGAEVESLTNGFTVIPAKVSVPNVVGDTQAAATTAITSAGLILGTVTTQSSTTVASGKVISENPLAGTSVNASSAVSLVVSSGPAPVSVPNVVGDTQAAATTAITSAGLVLGTVTMQSSTTVAAGKVIGENPIAGTSVNAGSAVSLVVSSGPAPVSVPNVVGDTQAAATTTITGAGLVLGTVTTQSSTTVAAGKVISENPIAGTSVNAGSAVNITVSSGSSGPASIQVSLSGQVVAPDGSITVTPVALDGNGNVITPSPAFTINITAVGTTSGNHPVVNGDTITFPKLNKKLLNQNPTVDPNGLFADTDPSDPNYGKQTGGVYQVTASIASPALTSPPVLVVVIPSSSATITAETYTYANQLNGALGQIVSAYGNPGHSGLNAAKAALDTVIANVNFSADVLKKNQVLAPPDGQLVTPDMLTGFTASPDDQTYATTLNSLIAAVQNATVQVNALNTSNPTMAQVMAIQSATATYKSLLLQLNALNPSAIELATLSNQINELYSSDIPTLLDSIKNQVNAMVAPFSGELRKSIAPPMLLARVLARMHLAPQLLDIFFVGFGACFDLEGQALNNIITLSVSLAQDIINLEAAGIINKNAPPGLSIDVVIASASLSFACPDYSNTEIDGFGFDPNPANDATLVVGAANSGNIANLATLSIPKGIGQAITLIYTLISTAKSLSDTLNFSVIQIPDQFIPGGGIFGDGSDALIFSNGWSRANQGIIPVVGLVVVTNSVAGTFAATTIDLLGECGG